MKPAPFDYVAPRSVIDAVAALREAGGTAKVLAGGQSLLQDLRWRRATPSLVVDIAGVRELTGVTVVGDTVRIGALVRHVDLETGAVPGPLGALLAATARYIAHPPVRSRGTMVGSLAWAHPAAEWCALATGLGANVTLAGPSGTRELSIADLFLGPGRTACAPDELMTAVTLPLLGEQALVDVLEHRRTHASFAQLVVTVALHPDNGVLAAADIGLGNAAQRPRRAHAAAATLVGTPGNLSDLARAAAVAARDDADPLDEPHASVAYKRQLVEVLVRRALHRAIENGKKRQQS